MSQKAEDTIAPKKREVNEVPPQAFLKECFDYCPETGQLTWRERPLHHFNKDWVRRSWNTKSAGKSAGTPCETTPGRFHLVLQLTHGKGNGKIFLAHRIVYQWWHGDLPIGMEVDHANLNPSDNAIENLRLATHQENNFNVKRKTFFGRARSLPKGVYPNGPGKWQAKIKFNYKNECLGTYTSPEEASEAYMRRARELFGEFARQD